MDRSDLLNRIAVTLKQQIGPNVADEFAKTQTYMASVVLDKLARELGAEAQHIVDKQAAINTMVETLANIRAQRPLPDMVHQALNDLEASPGAKEICTLIETLYRSRAEFENDAFTALLNAVREYSRFDIDQRLAIAE